MLNPTEIYERIVDRGYIPGLVDENRDPIPQTQAGCQIRFTAAGIAVYMPWNEPGKFYGDHGQEYPEAMAKMAGYDIERLATARKRMDAMRIAGQEIEAQFSTSGEKFVELERGDYKMVNIGAGRYQIEFSDGSSVNQVPLAKDVAMQVMDALVPPVVEPETKPKTK